MSGVSKLGLNKNIHIIGICGTFMAGVASLAKSLGYAVTGCDRDIYPPMSTYLQSQDIDIIKGFDASQLKSLSKNTLIIIGNVAKRGMPIIEELLNNKAKYNYTSGPDWLRENILKNKKVIAVAGTHGKTSTSSMLAWILTKLGLNPGFFIGGIPKNFGHPVALGCDNGYFVIEADEYDTAFFDKRAKLVHYFPDIFILNNLEYDHADIYENLDAIKKQVHHGVRLVPENGKVILPNDDANLKDVLDMGVFCNKSYFKVLDNIDLSNLSNLSNIDKLDWSIRSIGDNKFNVYNYGKIIATGSWDLKGRYNLHNALAAIIAACECYNDINGEKVKVSAQEAVDALFDFKGVKRRCECIYDDGKVKIYDDFAHHPTAVKEALLGFKSCPDNLNNKPRLVAMLEPRSNTMRMNIHQDNLVDALKLADLVYVYIPKDLDWNSEALLNGLDNCYCFRDTQKMLEHYLGELQDNDECVIMSNGGFDGVHGKLINSLSCKSKA